LLSIDLLLSKGFFGSLCFVVDDSSGLASFLCSTSFFSLLIISFSVCVGFGLVS